MFDDVAPALLLLIVVGPAFVHSWTMGLSGGWMSKGMFTAVSGAVAQSAKLDTIANNLANVNTPGFKRDSQLFREYLTSYEKEPGTITVPRVPASIESFYDMQGGDKSYVDLNGTSTDFTQGGIRQTGNTLDFAIDGNGFFEVATPEGVKLTRNGSFSIDSNGRLVTKQGFPVLREGQPGSDPAAREIRVTSANVSVSAEGEIFENGQSAGRLSMVNVANKDALSKVGQSLFGFRPTIDPGLSLATDSKCQQGMLEGSNVNIVREMTDMIGATRVFESTQKAIQAYDQMAHKAVNEVPKLSGGA
jgi:flagellar basal-body rod protein FlgG